MKLKPATSRAKESAALFTHCWAELINHGTWWQAVCAVNIGLVHKKELVALDATFCRVLLSYWQGFNLKYPNSIKYNPWNVLFNNSPAFTVHVLLNE